MGTVVWHALHGTLPSAFAMGAVGPLPPSPRTPRVRTAVGLSRGRREYASAWVCTRNDVLGNIAVLLAAAGVFGTGTGWPDIIVAAIMAGLSLQGASSLRQSLGELRKSQPVPELISRRGRRNPRVEPGGTSAGMTSKSHNSSA